VKLLSTHERSADEDVGKNGTEKKYTRESFAGKKYYLKRRYVIFYQLHNILKIIKCGKVT
jgi:hypothetical protein